MRWVCRDGHFPVKCTSIVRFLIGEESGTKVWKTLGASHESCHSARIRETAGGRLKKLKFPVGFV